jgi:peroxiredoxin
VTSPEVGGGAPPDPLDAPAPKAAPVARRRAVGPFSVRQAGLAIAAVAITALVLVGLTTPIGPGDPGVLPDPRATAYVIASPTTGLGVGDVPPGFEVRLEDGSTFQLRDLDGEAIRLEDLRGQGVWVNFWATWCPPCQAETPTLRDVHDAYRDRGLVLVAIDVQETVEDARAYADRYDLGYTIGADLSGEVFRAWQVFALPTQFFIGPDGAIRSVVSGPLEADRAAELVESILPGR